MKRSYSSLITATSRNVLFWALIPYIHYSGKSGQAYFILAVLLFIAYAGAGYVNNYFLIPRLLMRRLYLWYILSLVVVICLNTYWAHTATNAFTRRFGNIDFQAAANHGSSYYFAITTMIVCILLALGKITGDALTNQRRLEELERKRLESELTSLRSQMNPHFLFNALNTIYGMARRTDHDTAEAVLMLSDILRHGLYECDHQFITLEKELSFVNNYIEFAKMRVHDKNSIAVHMKVPETDYDIAPLLLIPFVENAIKHGLGMHATDGHVQVELSMANDELLFRCENSNFNKNKSAIPDGRGGVGLKNVRRRLELIYPGKHNLAIFDDESMFTVELKLQLQAI